jgi:hypothetical protein
MRTSFSLPVFVLTCVAAVATHATGAAAASPCTEPDGKDGMPKALASPKELARKTLEPGKSFDAGPLKISLSKAIMPAFVGSTQGEAVVDGNVVHVADLKRDGESSKNSASMHLPGVIRLGGHRVTFTEAGKTALAAFDVKVDELGCDEIEHGPAMKKGQTRTMWLSMEGVSAVKMYEGDEHFSSDYFELYLTSGLNENSSGKVMLDDANRPLTRAWISLRGVDNNSTGRGSGELNAIKINTPGSSFATDAYKVDVLRVMHGPKTKLRFKEPYAPADPVVSVLVRVTRTK